MLNITSKAYFSRKQTDIMELVKELNAETYDQYIEGTKCIRLDSDDVTKTYQSALPSVGVAATLDMAQALTRVSHVWSRAGISVCPIGAHRFKLFQSARVAFIFVKRGIHRVFNCVWKILSYSKINLMSI